MLFVKGMLFCFVFFLILTCSGDEHPIRKQCLLRVKIQGQSSDLFIFFKTKSL